MTQSTTGIYKLLSPGFAYSLFSAALGAESLRREFVQQYIRPTKGDRILDIGCGTGEIAPLLNGCQYEGYDLSERYIARAQKKYGAFGSFSVGDVSQLTDLLTGRFDIVVVMGVLHHLDDHEAGVLFATARQVLNERGRMVSSDPTYAEGQHPFAKWLVGRDRGKNIRDELQIRQIASAYFSKIIASTRHDLLRIPYSHLLVEYGSGSPTASV